MSTFVKNLPADSGWYWIKYRGRHGEVTVPCEVAVIGESTVVRTARGDSFTDKTRKPFGFSHALFGPKIELVLSKKMRKKPGKAQPKKKSK